MFPRAGDNSSVSWTKDEVIARTPVRNYSAFDFEEMYNDLGLNTVALKFQTQEPDLADFASPGVNTFVTFGYNCPTPGPFTFSQPFKKGVIPPWPTNVTMSGDTLAEIRSSIRGLLWLDDLRKEGKILYYKAYKDQVHANCILPPGFEPDVPDDGCYDDVYNLIVNGTPPANLFVSP